jgi:hypothetical protein
MQHHQSHTHVPNPHHISNMGPGSSVIDSASSNRKRRKQEFNTKKQLEQQQQDMQQQQQRLFRLNTNLSINSSPSNHISSMFSNANQQSNMMTMLKLSNTPVTASTVSANSPSKIQQQQQIHNNTQSFKNESINVNKQQNSFYQHNMTVDQDEDASHSAEKIARIQMNSSLNEDSENNRVEPSENNEEEAMVVDEPEDLSEYYLDDATVEKLSKGEFRFLTTYFSIKYLLIFF